MRKSCLLYRLFLCGLASINVAQLSNTCVGQSPTIVNEPVPSSNLQAETQAPERFGLKDKNCVPGMNDYPALQKTYGNPYRIMDCRNGDCESTTLNRWKRSMQASHWGYPEYFHKNSYGYANRNAFANNIRDAAIERSTLYLLDFYPEDSPYAHMLTPTGLERLEKSICVGTTLGSVLRIEKSARPELNELRRQWLAAHPSIVAAGFDADSIQVVARPIGIQASEAIYRYQRGIISGQTNTSSGTSSSASTTPIFQGMGSSTGSQSNR